MIKTEIKYKVLYAHTDQMGVVYYGRYYEYFEAGRNDMLYKIGYPYPVLEKKKIILPVIESDCRYYIPAKYDQEITIRSILYDIPSVRIKIYYEIYFENHLLADGFTVHSFVNSEKMKPARPPEDFLELIKRIINEDEIFI